jgi:hypothetical protein
MEDRVMKKLTSTALLALALVVAAVPAFGQTAETAAVVPVADQAAEAPTSLNDLFPAAEILNDGAQSPVNAAGGGSGCYYTCDCAGTPLRCCPNLSGGYSCKVTDVIQCPQVYNC